MKKSLFCIAALVLAAAFSLPAIASPSASPPGQVVATIHAGAAAVDVGIATAVDIKETMTLKIAIAHASPNYPAIAHVAKSGSYVHADARDGNPPVERYIHSGASAVIHELQPGETVAMAEDRALARMWGAYSHTAGGKAFDGKPLPTWDQLGADRQACWRAALQAV